MSDNTVDGASRQQTVLLHLQRLQQQLQDTSLWSESEPSCEALASTQPFACDTLSFAQWLQFIFIPKMQQLCEQQQPLPTHMALLPMAEQCWKHSRELTSVIDSIAALDDVINRGDSA